MTMLAVLTGCSSRGPSGRANVDSRPIEGESAGASDCVWRCVEFGRTLSSTASCESSRALGAVPRLRDGLPHAEGISETGANATRARVQLPALLDVYGADDSPKPPAMLTSASGHVHALIGRVCVPGATLFQVVHGSSPPTLCSAQQLLAAFPQGYMCTLAQQSGMRLCVGEGAVTVSHRCHNFGRVERQSELVAGFTVTNEGPRQIRIAKQIRTSCGCTSVEKLSRTELEPSESVIIRVRLKTGDVESLHYTVTPTLIDAQTNKTLECDFHLYGNRQPSLEVVPATLDFGTLPNDGSLSRVIRLSEVTYDRFTVQGTDCREPALSSKVEAERSREGLMIYRIKISLDETKLISGTHQDGIVTIRTTSVVRPVIEVPYHFQVE
jgi:hypothetical protein